MQDYADYDGLALAELVRSRQVSAEELLRAAIERVERLNPSLNAVVFRADALAQRWASQAAPGPFQGVPLLLKDVMGLCEGMPTRLGSASMPAEPSARDAEIVTRFRRAGFVPFAKTNAPEFGLLPTTESVLYGPAKNPWDLSRSPGGSSGGSAAAVAAGIVPIAHANDGGGSIRIPASCCGLLGLKPTRGRVSLAPGVDPSGLVIEHVVTRSVRDSAAVLDALAGSIPGDPQYFPPPERSFASMLDEPLASLRIAVLESDPHERAYDPRCAAALRTTADQLQNLGHQVHAARPKFDVAMVSFAFRQLWYCQAAVLADGQALLRGQPARPEEFDPLTFAMVELGRGVTATEYQIARFLLDGMTRRIAHFMRDYDLLLSPTLSAPPLPLGTLDVRSRDVEAEMAKIEAYVAWTPIANATGFPAISLPLQTSPEGLPIGLQLMAAADAEATLLQIARQLELAQPWQTRRPRLHA
jgi:amidase